MNLLSSMNHNVPELVDQNLEISSNLKLIREKINEGGYFEDLVKRCFLKNERRVILTANPDPDFIDKKNQDEEKLLTYTQTNLKKDSSRKIIEDAQKLQLKQEEPQDNSCLPSLKVTDIEAREQFISCEKFEVNGVGVSYFTQCPDGVSFLN